MINHFRYRPVVKRLYLYSPLLVKIWACQVFSEKSIVIKSILLKDLILYFFSILLKFPNSLTFDKQKF